VSVHVVGRLRKRSQLGVQALHILQKDSNFGAALVENAAFSATWLPMALCACAFAESSATRMPFLPERS